METLRVMSALAKSATRDEYFRRGVLELFATAPNLLEVDRIVRGHFRYRPEHEEIVRAPGLMLLDWQATGKFEGDCDDVSTMLGAVLSVLGYRSRFVAIRYGNHDAFEHVFVEAYTSNAGWVILDPTVREGTTYDITERMVEAL